MDFPNNLKELLDMQEKVKILECYVKLTRQKNNPTRQGMIDALSSAKKLAPHEITSIETRQGEVYLTAWEAISDEELYRKLSDYQLGLYNFCIKKWGKEKFEDMLRDYVKKLNQM